MYKCMNSNPKRWKCRFFAVHVFDGGLPLAASGMMGNLCYMSVFTALLPLHVLALACRRCCCFSVAPLARDPFQGSSAEDQT
mmetsp:Transcript_15465/g.27697  ORF Transcript_15465/g.27697 Transcript_15465/m.27697 type:complete len:82 (-) Transcript_15465:8-253(-)